MSDNVSNTQQDWPDFFDWDAYYGFDSSEGAGCASDDVETRIHVFNDTETFPEKDPHVATCSTQGFDSQPLQQSIASQLWPMAIGHTTSITVGTGHAFLNQGDACDQTSAITGTSKVACHSAGQFSTALYHSTPAAPKTSFSGDGDGAFIFKSGFRVIEDKGPAIKKTEPADVDGLKCPEPHCSYKGTFKRKYEVQRHIKSKHANYSPKLACPVVGCNRRGERSFRRADKLADHIIKGHEADDLFECLQANCRIPPMGHPAFIIHTYRHEIDNDFLGAVRRALRIECPVQQCTCSFQMGFHIQAHLLHDHTDDERTLSQRALLKAGFHHSTADTCCPICGESWRWWELLNHLLDKHLQVDEQHFNLWRQTLADSYQHSRTSNSLGLWHLNQPYVRQLDCPHCHETLDHREVERHHFKALHGWESLYEHRVTFLALTMRKHWGFRHMELYAERYMVYLPIWDDIDPTSYSTVRGGGT